MLYRLVQLHAASVIAHTEASTGAELPRFTRPALSDERVQLNAVGQVELKLKTKFQWRLTCTQVTS